jgi:RHS repeat-associated protein
MSPLRNFLQQISRLISEAAPYAGFAFVAAFVCLIVGAYAYASTVTVTYSGTITSMNDVSLFFGSTTTAMNGKSFTLTYKMDDTKGSTYLGTWPTCNNGLQATTTTGNPVPQGILTITGGNRPYTWGALAYQSLGANVSSSNAGSPLTKLTNKINPVFTGGTAGLSGSENGSMEIDLNSINNCRNWEASWLNYTLTTGDSSTGTISADYANSDQGVSITDFSTTFDILNFSISGTTTTSGQTLASAQTLGFQCHNQNVVYTTCWDRWEGSTAEMCQTTDGRPESGDACWVISEANGGIPVAHPDCNVQPVLVSYPNAQTCEPINAAGGNVYLTETDFLGGGPMADLTFTRFYNSNDPTQSGFGVGWHSNFHRALTLTSSTSITVTNRGGSEDTFTLTGGIWTPQANITSALTSTTSPVAYKLTYQNDSVENYNSTGQLTSIVTRGGLTTSLSYSATGNLSTITDPYSNTLSFGYDALGRVTTMTLPDGTTKFGYSYDSYNNLASVNNPDGTYHQYAHGAWPFTNLITDYYDEDANDYASWTYDSQGRGATQSLAAGVNQETLAYTTSTLSTITDALGNTTSYVLTGNFGNIVPTTVGGVPSPHSGGASFTYDTNGFIASVTDYNGNVTNFTHNSKGQETSRTEAYGTALARTTTTKWHATFNLPIEIDQPLSVTTTLGYDANGNLTSRSVTDGTNIRKITMTYNANNQITSETDALGNTSTWTYDASGNKKTFVDALGQTTTYNTYDGNGRIISLTDPLSLTTTYAYDKLGRITSVKVGGLTTSYTWDSGANKISKITYPDNSTLTSTFDDAHRVIEVKDTAGDAIKYTYDNMSNLTAVNVYDPTPTLKYTHSYTYDTQNRMMTSVGAGMGETTTYLYDSQSNPISITDALSHTSTYTYDALNRLATLTDALSNTSTFGYDALDRTTTVTDPRGLVTSYQYTGLGQTTTISSPDTGTTVITYDADGNELTSTDARGKVTSYYYDALKRTTTITYTGGSSVVLTYDTGTNGTGHLTKMVDPAGTTSWTYDQYGDVLSKSQTTGSLTLTTTYTYDSDKRLSTIKYPSTKTLTYAYDSSGRISGITGGVTSISYFPFGMAKQWTEPNSTTYLRGFDQDGRITSVTLNSTTTNVQTITYDNANRITGLTETGLSNKTYGYDSDDRLTSFFNGTATTSYTYDADGNRTSMSLSGTTTLSYTTTSNMVQSLTGTTTANYGYDAMGNTTSDGTNVWTYDARGRMSTLTAGTTTAAYDINGFGQRIEKTGSSVPSGGTNEYVYDEQGNLIGEYGSTGTIIEETGYLPDTPISVLAKGFGLAGLGRAVPTAVYTGTNGSTVSSTTPDWLGAPHIIANSSKTYQWRWDHYDFGNNAPNQNPSGLGTFNYNLRFPGQYYDAESSLFYNGLRDYNPNSIGRYIESDPMGIFGGSFSLYPYVNNNPITLVDLQGLATTIPTGGPLTMIPQGPNGGPWWTLTQPYPPYMDTKCILHCEIKNLKKAIEIKNQVKDVLDRLKALLAEAEAAAVEACARALPFLIPQGLETYCRHGECPDFPPNSPYNPYNPPAWACDQHLPHENGTCPGDIPYDDD